MKSHVLNFGSAEVTCLVSLCQWVTRKKGLVQFESQSYVTEMCSVLLISAICKIDHANNRFSVPVNQPMIYTPIQWTPHSKAASDIQRFGSI